MNPKPKIVVLRMREIIYTLLLLCLIILLVVCLFFMFAPSSQKGQRQPASENLSETSSGSETSLSTDLAQASSRKVSGDALYTAGVYTSPVALGTSSAEVEVTVDTDEIRSIRLIHLSEAAEAMYPWQNLPWTASRHRFWKHKSWKVLLVLRRKSILPSFY